MFRCRRVEGYPKYFVTSEGEVYSNHIKGFMKKTLKHERDGYVRVELYNESGGKFLSVHRLVAKAFVANPEGKPHVNHLNNNRSDNRVENLEWCTPKENHAHAIKQGRRHWSKGEDQWRSRFTEKDVLRMRSLYKEGQTQKAIGGIFGTSQAVVSKIVRRGSWKHI